MGEATRDLRSSGTNALTFRSAYDTAFRAFLASGSEATLRAGYELGRHAVSGDVGLLELAHTHHAVLLAALTDSTEPADSQRITDAAAGFLLEALSAYEMVRLGVAEARESVAFERRQAAIVRQLSTLLADASLAAHAHASITEVLQLVSEQARELTGAVWCAAHVGTGLAHRREIFTCAGSEPSDLRALVLEAYAAIEAHAETAEVVQVEMRPRRGELVAAPLTALDGRIVGVLAIATDGSKAFTALERSVLRHIGQMTAAALERALPYDAALR
jgi:GAF domain-containing protein